MRLTKYMPIVAGALKLIGLYQRGLRNALDIHLTHHTFAFPDLPSEFDGYRIVHLSDLHLDYIDEITERLIAILRNVEAELCLCSGDFRDGQTRGFSNILLPMRQVIASLHVSDGFYATLGNHDQRVMIQPLRELGVEILRNETTTIARGSACLNIVGLDGLYVGQRHRDRHPPPPAPTSGFTVVLTHAPDLVETASHAGASLYLAGHTHGGQICLPGGRPIIANVDAPRAYLKGRWQAGTLQGFTNSGVSVSSLPVRFNTRGEVALITLRRDSSPKAQAT